MIHGFAFPTSIRFGPGARSEVARHLIANGRSRPLVVTDRGLAALPVFERFLADRLAIRDAVGSERFVEIYVKTSLETRKRRDQRGAYGPGHPQPSEEAPKSPDLVVSLDNADPEEAAQAIIAVLVKRGLLPSAYAL